MKRNIEPDISQRIEAARVLCIAAMMFVHVRHYEPAAGLAAASAVGFDLLENFLRDGVSRASVGPLSMISGFLLWATLAKGAKLPDLIQRRFFSIYVPMIIWALITLAVYTPISMFIAPTFLDRGLAETTNSALYLLNTVFFITHAPEGATLHLAFLRDIFMCVVISPLLLKLIRVAPILLFTGLVALFVLKINSIIVLRPLILLSFAIGLFLAEKRVNLSAADRYLPLWAVLFAASSMLIIGWDKGIFPKAMHELTFAAGPMSFDIKTSVLAPLVRLTGSLFVWTAVARLAGAAWIMQLRPVTFLAYCSHVLALTVIYYAIWRPLVAGPEDAFYPVWFLMAPAVSFAVAMALFTVLKRISPTLAAMLSGNRLEPSAGRAGSLKRDTGQA